MGADGDLSEDRSWSCKLVEPGQGAGTGGQRYAARLAQDPNRLLGIQGRGLYLVNLYINLDAELKLGRSSNCKIITHRQHIVYPLLNEYAQPTLLV